MNDQPAEKTQELGAPVDMLGTELKVGDRVIKPVKWGTVPLLTIRTVERIGGPNDGTRHYYVYLNGSKGSKCIANRLLVVPQSYPEDAA